MNNLFGQYNYKDTLIHKLDPRAKIIGVIFFSIYLFFLNNYTSFILVSFFIISIAFISRITILRLWLNVKPFLFFFAFILLMHILFSKDKFYEGVIVVWRFIILIIMAAILTFSTSISELTYAIEKLLSPLKIIGVNSRDLALMISITVRYIPLLFFEAGKIEDALKCRGMKLKKIKHIILLVKILLRKIFEKAKNLADAIESRCYTNSGYTHFKD